MKVTEKELCEYCATTDCKGCIYKDICANFYFINNYYPYSLLVPYDISKGIPIYDGDNPDNSWINKIKDGDKK